MNSDTNIKVGDYVRAFTPRRDQYEHTLPSAEGIVTDIRQKKILFSEDYVHSSTETSVHILAGGAIQVFYIHEDYIEVISR